MVTTALSMWRVLRECRFATLSRVIQCVQSELILQFHCYQEIIEYYSLFVLAFHPTWIQISGGLNWTPDYERSELAKQPTD